MTVEPTNDDRMADEDPARDLLYGSRSGTVTPSAKEKPTWWRVHFHLHAAGGRLLPTWRKVMATDEATAIAAARRKQKSDDHAKGRCPVGYFAEAHAELAPDLPTVKDDDAPAGIGRVA